MNPPTKSVAYLHKYTAEEATVTIQFNNTTKMLNIPLKRFNYVQAPEVGTRAREIGTSDDHTIIDYNIEKNTVRMTNGTVVDMKTFIEKWEYETPIGQQTQRWTEQISS